MVLPVLAATATRVAATERSIAAAKKTSSLEQETIRRSMELNSARKRDREQEQSRHNYAAEATGRRARQKMAGKALTLLTGGMALPLGLFGGRIVGILSKGMDLGISDIFKLVFLVLGLVVLGPILIVVLLPLSPLIFAFSLAGVVAMFMKR